ncbi:MAG: DUF47 family protein [Coxiella endosymbiont of Dermacentor silvarum]
MIEARLKKLIYYFMLPQISILNIFGCSPVQLLRCHKEKVHNFMKLPLYFCNMLIVRDWKQTSSLQQDIIQFETKNDKLKHEFHYHFSKILFPPPPIPFNDLLVIFLENQIKIANTIKNVSVIIVECRIEVLSFQAQEVINEIDNFLALCFQRKQENDVDKIIQKLNDIKYQTNQLQIQVQQPLQIKNTLLSINVIFLYKIIKNQLLKRPVIICNYQGRLNNDTCFL